MFRDLPIKLKYKLAHKVRTKMKANIIPIQFMCRVLKVIKSTYYQKS